MNVSLKWSAQTIADLMSIGDDTPAASNETRGSPLTMVRRLRATQPARPVPFFSVRFNSFGASTPAANRHFSESASGWVRNKAHADQGTTLVSFDEMSAMVSAMP